MTNSAQALQLDKPRIVLVTPLKDEENYVDGMIKSILQQEILPTRWILVDDGSTDKTPEIIRGYCRENTFMELIQLPVRAERLPGGEGAITSALRLINLSDFDYVARFDADLAFGNNYFTSILQEFSKDGRLGIAGGGLYIEQDGLEIMEVAPDYHVRGALKMYRVECFRQIGPLGTQIGWDTMDEVYAWRYGWRTGSFQGIRVLHRRPTGRGIHNARIYQERGRAEYLTWSHPLFVVLKFFKLLFADPGNAYHFLYGFLSCHRNREERLLDPLFRRTRREQQIGRMLSAVLPR
jgi:biofilm PGA synthesis N-glycosyltransferase PgaC